MEIHGNSVNFNKECVKTTQSCAEKKLEEKTAQASSLNALASYGRAQVNTRSFKGAENQQNIISIPAEQKMKLLDVLDIKDQEKVKDILSLTDIQLMIVLPFMYSGHTLSEVKSMVDLEEDFTQDEDLIESLKKSENFIVYHPQEAIEFCEYLKNDPKNRFQSAEDIVNVIFDTTTDTIDIVKSVVEHPRYDFSPFQIGTIMKAYHPETAGLIQNLLNGEETPYSTTELGEIIWRINPDNIDIANQLIYKVNSRFDAKQISQILNGSRKDTVEFVQRLIDDKDLKFTDEELASIISPLKEANLEAATKIIYSPNQEYSAEVIKNILFSTNKFNAKIVNSMLSDTSDKKYTADQILETAMHAQKYTIDVIEDLVANPNYSNEDKTVIMTWLERRNVDLYKYMQSQPSDRLLDPKHISEILLSSLRKEFCADFAKNIIAEYKDKGYNQDELSEIIAFSDPSNIELVKVMTDASAEKRLPVDGMSNIISSIYDIDDKTWEKHINPQKYEVAKLFVRNTRGIDSYKIAGRLRQADEKTLPFFKELLTDTDDVFTDEEISRLLKEVLDNKKFNDNLEELIGIICNIKDSEIPKTYLFAILENPKAITIAELKQLERILGKENAKNLSVNELMFANQFKDFCMVDNINEIPISRKKDVLRRLVECNVGLFDVSDKLRKYFPLLPSTTEEYCALLPSLVRSLGIETNYLSESDVKEFNASLNSLSDELKELSDNDFNNLTISQEYPKSEFIKDVFKLVKDLPHLERQKVYDYFGFELHSNKNGTQVDENKRHKFSILGYPVNLNNGKKLAQITDPKTKKIVEKLRPIVVKFSQNNQVLCSNKNVEKYLNKIVKAFPELRTQIEKIQHSGHKFDIMKHSLKVMQKVTQHPIYGSLSDSDKNIILLASLFHDINKAEGYKDKTHANESAFDVYYIINKLNLSKDEKIKLYSLIKHHEWLGYVNKKDITEEEKIRRRHSVAFDLQYDNLFELSTIFTSADLKAVRGDDKLYSFFENTYKENTKLIQKDIEELKKSQPLLPVTKIPKASRISKAITTVNPDGSTNIKGVYKNADGLVVIKFNEVDDWEKIGFASGSISKGIQSKGVYTKDGLTEEYEVNTGNIKFFVHGLDFSNQLAKFDAFALPDSDALLSVSYTERPESKYRFFRQQGVLLDVDTKYTHGGGNTDMGSGCGKDIDEFKKNYIFGGVRESDRTYISDLIKEALNLSDEEYVQFVKANANKPLSEIKPKEAAEAIIKAFSTINSNVRKGDRNYNEMYISNPRVMGVFAYSATDSVGNINEFMSNQKEFLKQYAIDNDLPFVVFGD